MKKPLVYLLLFGNLAIILYFWWSNSGVVLTSSMAAFLLGLGRLFGLLAVYCVLLQFILIGRSPWIERTFGLDKLSQIHRLNGRYLIFLILLHPIFLILGYSGATGLNFIDQFLNLYTNSPDVWLAVIALVLFITIVFTSIWIVRKKLKYEWWYTIHLLTYLAVFLSFGHQQKNGEDFLAFSAFNGYWFLLYGAVLGNHLVFRFLRPWYQFYTHHFYVDHIIQENHNTNSLYIKGKNLHNFPIQPGQFMILRFLDTKRWYEAHPFSLSCFPNDQFIRITPKAVGDFTSALHMIKPNTPVVIDGPLGSFTNQKATHSKVLLIAGGVGVTPLRTLCEEFVHEKKDLVFLYGNRKKEDILFPKEFDYLARKYPFKMIHVLSNEPRYQGETGYVDEARIRRLVPDIMERDVFLCGPIPMMNMIIKALQDLGVPKSQVHFERFAL